MQTPETIRNPQNPPSSSFGEALFAFGVALMHGQAAEMPEPGEMRYAEDDETLDAPPFPRSVAGEYYAYYRRRESKAMFAWVRWALALAEPNPSQPDVESAAFLVCAQRAECFIGAPLTRSESDLLGDRVRDWLLLQRSIRHLAAKGRTVTR